jgi:hypothetical protein
MSLDRQLWLFTPPSATLASYHSGTGNGLEMSELTERQWAVLSERGCEATALTYAQAIELIRKLGRERVAGLSVITDAAASRAAPNTRRNNRGKSNGTGKK